MNEDKEIYKLIGEVLGKLDGIRDLLGASTRRIDRIEGEVNKNRDDISAIKQQQAKQMVLYSIAMAVVSALVYSGLHLSKQIA